MPTRTMSSQPQTRWMLPLRELYLTRATLRAILREHGVRLYWRALTPLVVI